MIRDLIESVMAIAFGVRRPEDSCTGADIGAAEQRLGIVLPEALRDYYATAGRHRGMMDAGFHMLPPDKLRLAGDCLVFCEENQYLAEWGIQPADGASPNPRVSGRARNTETWYSEASKLSGFLIHVATWQAVMSLPERSRCELPEKKLKTLEPSLEHIGEKQLRSGGHRVSFIDRHNRLLATYLYNSETLYVGATRPEALEAFEARCGLALDAL
ncbi:SMI1/KNR4 family protein [Sorangium sp. So ce394]|uniref:SMI1/KNR4 family protein n=1 Tax=Sorangium sp. So ce394 TaxID=3133310 RepID=UPI003F5B1F58